MSQTPEMTFEKALEQLSTTVKKLESGELPLEEALKTFEQGVKLSKDCQAQLVGAEQRVEQLLKASVAADGQEKAEFGKFQGSSRG